jgi:phage terminase small subunit
MTELTAKQEAFCQHYARYRGAAAAYMHAYNVKTELPATIATNASKILANTKISQRWREIAAANTAATAATVSLGIKDIFEKLCLQIVTDPRELMNVKTGNCRHCNGDEFGYQWRTVSEFQKAFGDWQAAAEKFGPLAAGDAPDISGGIGWRPFHAVNPECPECGGAGVSHASLKPSDEYSPGAAALFEGVKQTQHGIEVKTADKAKALEMAVRMLGGFDDKLELKGALAATLKAVVATATDQKSAADMYAAMVKGS